MSDDFERLLDLVAETLRPAAGVLPDQPSDEEVAALRAAVGQQFPRAGLRLIGGRRPLPIAIGAAAAAALLSTAGVAAAATSVVEPLRLAQTVAHDIGLPVDDPNISDAHSTLRDLTAAYLRHDTRSVVRQMGKLRTELGRLDSNDRNALMRQITAKTPGIAAQLSNGSGSSSNPGTATGPTGSTSTTVPTNNGNNQNVPPPDPSTTVPPDTTPTTVPPHTTPTTLPPDTTPSTTIPPDTTTLPTDTSTTAPPDTKAPDTITTSPNQSQTGTTTTSVP